MNLAVTQLEMTAGGAWTIGNQEILRRPLLGFFASTRCPGDVILRIYDTARKLRDEGIPVVSGFHTPMEKECLALLLRGTQPIVICPARSLHRMRIPSPWRPAIDAGRLLLLSPFAERHRRITAELAGLRNQFVAETAAEIFIAHAAPGSKTEGFCRELIAAGKRIRTFDVPGNAGLVALGARPLKPDAALAAISKLGCPESPEHGT